MSGFYNGFTGQYRIEKNAAARSTAPSMLRKSFEFSTKAINEPKGIVSAAVNAIGLIDLQKDLIEPGAWTSVINKFQTRQQAWPSVLVNHDWNAGVGVVTDAYEGSDQLYVDAKFNLETQAGRDAFSNARAGVYKNWSVGFGPGDVEYDAHGVRHIKSIDFFPEVSLVLVGASPGTRTLATKAASPNQQIARIIEDIAHRTGVDPHKVAQAVVEHLRGGNDEIPTPKLSLSERLDHVHQDPNWMHNGEAWIYAPRSQSSPPPSALKPVDELTDDELYRRWIHRWGMPPVSDK